MCTAITLNTDSLYFGRTLDLDVDYKSQIVITPRNFGFKFKSGETVNSHYAIIGMAAVSENYPLYFDAANEKGLCIAGLNFSEDAVFEKPNNNKNEIAPFELIPYLLCTCKNTYEAKEKLKDKQIAEIPFNKQLGCAKLHWIISDKRDSIVIESTKNGMKIQSNPTGILTNSPPLDYHLYNLNNYLNLTSETPRNSFSNSLELRAYSNGLGAIGMPGDYSSPSRFIRAVFTKYNTVCEKNEKDSVRRFFEILSTVEIPKGLVKTKSETLHYTLYSSCINTENGIYYYKLSHNRNTNAVSLFKENLDLNTLICYPLINETLFNFIN